VVSDRPSTRPLGQVSPPSPDDEPSPFELVNAVLQRWRITAAAVLVSAVLATVYWAVAARTYTATAAFVPESRSQARLPTGLSGFFGQLGMSLGADANESPRFYASVLKGRELSERILLTTFPVPSSGTTDPPRDSLPLLGILKVRGRNRADSIYNGVQELDRLVSAEVDNPTNIVRVSVEAPDPALAAAVANRLIEYLNDFNTNRRQSRAHERRRFAEDRAANAEAELTRVEEAVRTFRERNRDWQESPDLSFQEGRLRRQVDIAQEVYLTLKREYETARIDEVNDNPIITVIERAVPPQEPSEPRFGFLLTLAIVLSAFAGVCWALVTRYFDRARRENLGPYREFVALRQQARQEIGDAVRSATSKLRR
jgi:tyrosine-protein kinase Etk/Wzc